MQNRHLLTALLLTPLLSLPVPNIHAAVQAPVLKWQYGGCYSSWCETGWYSSPAVADLNNDGIPEVIASAYSIAVLDGPSGTLKWRVGPGKDRSSPPSYDHRTWPGIWVTDVDNDRSLDIITAHSGGYVSVYDQNGYFKPGWPQQPTRNELRGLVVNDIDRDGTSEVIVTGAVYGKTNTWVFEHSGALRPGWPQLDNSLGSAYGVFNDNAWVDDLDNDGRSEIVVPSDVTTLCTYRPDGTQINASSLYGDEKWGELVPGKIWLLRSGVGDVATEHEPRAIGATLLTEPLLLQTWMETEVKKSWSPETCMTAQWAILPANTPRFFSLTKIVAAFAKESGTGNRHPSTPEPL